MDRSYAKRRAVRSAQAKADAYRKRQIGNPNLADFVASSARIAIEYADAISVGSKMPYDDPQAVLRRWVYRYGQAYDDADMAPELKWYVEDRTDPARGLKADNTFVWFIRLIRLVHPQSALSSIPQSTWSKMAPILALAYNVDVDHRYLEAFIYMGGKMDGILHSFSPDHPPEWLSGLTRPTLGEERPAGDIIRQS